ncbi:MAG: FtsX-like permease family protein [Acidobacteria bacterium]|nr:FtsX-like permease family protein [Acidobacteriota bacterium]
MRLPRILRQRLRSLFRASQANAELARELEMHLDELTREYIADGMDPAEARRAARRVLGGVAQIEEQCREHRRVSGLLDPLRDFAQAGRSLAKSPGFTALATLTLALGVGGGVAAYALCEALLLRSLPYPEPERLVSVENLHRRQPRGGFVSQEKFRDWQAAAQSFERIAIAELSEATLTGDGEAERIEGRAVSPGFFEMLGVQPQLGRRLTPEEQQPGAACALLVSHDFWTRRLGARADAVGRTAILNGEPCRIAGVMPPRFHFDESGFGVAEYWRPIAAVTHNRLYSSYLAYARLRPGTSLETAQAEMDRIAARLEATYPEDKDWQVRVKSMRGTLLERFGQELAIFSAAALVVLLAACANVAGLLLARGVGRAREIAVRAALGAGRARLIRLLLAESLLLSGFASALGVLFAAWLLQTAIAASPAPMHLADSIVVSPWLVAFAVGLTVLSSLLAGLWPALRGSRTRLERDLRESGSGLVSGRRQIRSLRALVVTEAALSVLLLCFAGLLAKSFAHLLQADLGYRTESLLGVEVPLPPSRYRTAADRLRFWNALLDEAGRIPGALSAAASDSVPLGGRYPAAPVEVEGPSGPRDPAESTAFVAIVSPGYFQTLGIPLRAGRELGSETEPSVIVNQAFVRKFLADREPIGARVRIGSAWMPVIGVVEDALYFGPKSVQGPEARAYGPHTLGAYLQFLSIHTAGAEQSVVEAVREIVRRLDPQVPVAQTRTMRQSIDGALSTERQMLAALAGFSAIALAMAATGLSGVMLYTVSRRRREIGLRMALGAQPADIRREVLGGAVKLVAAGSALGAAAALAGGRALESLLYGVHWYDPAALAAAPALLLVAALAACLPPSRRASSIEPMEALRLD